MVSCNRNSTDCSCGLWRFNQLDVAGSTLMTFDEYFDNIGFKGSRDNSGYGYGRGYRNLPTFYQWKKEGSSCVSYATTQDGNPPRGEVGWLFNKKTEYAIIDESDQYRMAKIICPLCGRQYAGWLRAENTLVGEPIEYHLYDTSFYSSFHEESNITEDGATRVVNRELLISAWNEYKGEPE